MLSRSIPRVCAILALIGMVIPNTSGGGSLATMAFSLRAGAVSPFFPEAARQGFAAATTYAFLLYVVPLTAIIVLAVNRPDRRKPLLDGFFALVWIVTIVIVPSLIANVAVASMSHASPTFSAMFDVLNQARVHGTGSPWGPAGWIGIDAGGWVIVGSAAALLASAFGAFGPGRIDERRLEASGRH